MQFLLETENGQSSAHLNLEAAKAAALIFINENVAIKIQSEGISSCWYWVFREKRWAFQESAALVGWGSARVG